jgi:hypothetical protein
VTFLLMVMVFVDVFYDIFSSYCSLTTSLISLVSYTPSSEPVSCTERLSDGCQAFAFSLPLCLSALNAALPFAFRICGAESSDTATARSLYRA